MLLSLRKELKIPNIKPYRYPHHKNETIEGFVKDMMVEGLIRPSVCPYASPLLLVKKKIEVGGFVLIIGLSIISLPQISSLFR